MTENVNVDTPHGGEDNVEDRPKRTRRPNPYTTFSKAKQAHARALKAAGRLEDLAQKAEAARDKANDASERLAELEVELTAAREALEAAIGDDEDEGEEYDEDDYDDDERDA